MSEGTTPIAAWILEREGDGLNKVSSEIGWIEFDETGRGKELHKHPAIGRSLIMSPFNDFYTWQTTVVTEILEESEDLIRFKTKNSTYTVKHKK